SLTVTPSRASFPLSLHDALPIFAGVEDPALAELAGARGDVEEIYTAAAAESELLTAASLRTRLRGLGISSVQAPPDDLPAQARRSEEHTSELQSRFDLVCRLLLE